MVSDNSKAAASLEGLLQHSWQMTAQGSYKFRTLSTTRKHLHRLDCLCLIHLFFCSFNYEEGAQ